jgi:hypothetical protein
VITKINVNIKGDIENNILKIGVNPLNPYILINLHMIVYNMFVR